MLFSEFLLSYPTCCKGSEAKQYSKQSHNLVQKSISHLSNVCSMPRWMQPKLVLNFTKSIYHISNWGLSFLSEACTNPFHMKGSWVHTTDRIIRPMVSLLSLFQQYCFPGYSLTMNTCFGLRALDCFSLHFSN